MAPKKSKKKGKIGDDWGEEEDVDVALNKSPPPEPPAAAEKKAPKKKAKGKKGKPKFGDWDSDDEPDPLKDSVTEEENDTVAKKGAKKQSKANTGRSSAFALLQEGDDSEDQSGEEPLMATVPSKSAFGVLDAEDESSSEGEEDADGELQSKLSEESKLKVGCIVNVKKHPKADKLFICKVDIGSDAIQVVTNAANAAAGMTVVVATVGCKTPGSGIVVQNAKVRGVDSAGMLCSAYDVGWVEAADGVLLELPSTFSPGTDCPTTPPQGAKLGVAMDEQSKKSKSLSSSFSDLHLNGEGGKTEVLDDADDDGDVDSKLYASSRSSKQGKKKGKAGTAKPSFAALADAEEEVEDGGGKSLDDSEQFEELKLPPKRKKDKKKPPSFAVYDDVDMDADVLEADVPVTRKEGKETKGLANAFVQLEEEAASGAEDSRGAELLEDDDELHLPPKQKKGKKKALKQDLTVSSGLPEDTVQEDTVGEGIGHARDASEDLEGLQLPPKKGGRKTKATRASGVEENNLDDADLVAPAENGRKAKDVDNAFAQLGLDNESGAHDEDLAELSELTGKKKKKGKKLKDVDSLFAALEADADTVPASNGNDVATAEPAVDELEGPAGVPQESLLKPGVNGEMEKPVEVPDVKGKKKKKGAQAQAAEEDLDAILAELGMAPPATSEKGPTPATIVEARVPEGSSAENAAENAGQEEEKEDQDADSKELTAAQKKKLKKKAKEKEKKKAGAGEGEEETEEGMDTKKGKKGPKQSAAVKRLQEALEKERLAAEERRRAEEERIRQEEEAERLREEEEQRKAEETERKKAEKRERRAEMKRQGLILTGKAKKEAERLAAMREQFLRQTGTELVDGQDAPVKKKVVYDTRKKKPPPKKAEEEPALNGQLEDVPQEAVLMEVDQQARLQEVVVTTEVPKPEEVEVSVLAPDTQEEESEEDDWEAMDLDDLKLPGQEKAKQVKDAAPIENTAPAAPETNQTAHSEEGSPTEEEEEEEEDENESEDDESSSEASSSEEESSSYEMDSEEEAEEKLRLAKENREARLKKALEAGSKDHLRSPIGCILGHVDTGKTKLLDNIRRTNVQEGEAGGITQQIGATYVPMDAIQRRTETLRKGKDFELKLPGLLIIDTPGHESFSNLRSRGSGLCDIAILVVDLMHGLEPQTIESINLLKMRKTPFIVALNKVDRLFDWESTKDAPIQDSLAKQKDYVQAEFEKRLKASILALNEQGLNVALYWKNPDVRKFVNIVPTSAITGEGIPDMLQLLVKLTQSMMAERLMFISELQCTVLEVKVVEGHGTTIDVVLVNGVLHEGDTIVICGLQGPIVTTIRSLLTPHPLKELRVRGQYDHHKEVKAAQGIKIAAHGLENAVAGTQLLVVGPDDDVEVLKAEVMADMQDIFSSVDRSGEGVCVQASTLGSLEALLEFLKSPAVKIPVSAINIGPIHKKDIMRASVMLEKGRRKFCCILAFDVPVTREAAELAEKLGVRIFSADIIYHLFDQFSAYIKSVKDEEQEAAKAEVAFPCELTIMPNCIFNTKDPIILGVEVKEGIARVGTPICVPSQGGLDLGKIASLELNHKPVEKAVKGDMVAMKIEATKPEESSRLYGRHFDFKDMLVSRMTRKSIDLLKLHFKDELSRDDWKLVVKLKRVFNIE
eukprot:jgi/Botrbrau1/21555/Bobra.174_2s0055.2